MIYRPIDLHVMESKADCGKYEHLEEFRADIQTIVHNVVIYHGGEYLTYDQFSQKCFFWKKFSRSSKILSISFLKE